MPSPAAAPQEDLSPAELRVLVDVLVGAVRRLQADNAGVVQIRVTLKTRNPFAILGDGGVSEAAYRGG